MREKRLKAGGIAAAPHQATRLWTRGLPAGCPIHAEPLGPDHSAAVERATLLNCHLDSWRAGLGSAKLEVARRRYGTVAWLSTAQVVRGTGGFRFLGKLQSG